MLSKIQKLRELTGAGVVECQKALKETDGDFDRAIALIRERGFARAESKKERKTGAGLLHSYIHNGRVGVLLELRTETDFVARSDDFHTLARDVALQISAMNPETVDDLLKQVYVKDESLTVHGLIQQYISKLGENIKVERFTRYEI